MTCDFPEKHGPMIGENGTRFSVHCAWCLTHPNFKLHGCACPNGIRLETLPLRSAPGKKGTCLTCAEKKAQASAHRDTH